MRGPSTWMQRRHLPDLGVDLLLPMLACSCSGVLGQASDVAVCAIGARLLFCHFVDIRLVSMHQVRRLVICTSLILLASAGLILLKK